jgi:hypothetical protein
MPQSTMIAASGVKEKLASSTHVRYSSRIYTSLAASHASYQHLAVKVPFHAWRASDGHKSLLASLQIPKMNHPASDLVGSPAGLVALATMHGLRAGCIWRYTFVHVGRLR